jgi:hypothetical protein
MSNIKSIEEQMKIEEARKDKVVIDFTEIGSTGDYFSGGYETYEYQTELQGTKKFEEYDKMKRSSAMARATLKAITLPIIGGRWLIKPGGSSEVDKFQAEFIKRNLFYSMSNSWGKTVNEILQCIAYGLYPFEKIIIRSKNWRRWRFGGDWIVLKKLAPRHPITIDKVHFDTEGGIAGLEQSAYFNKGDSTQYNTVFLPIRKLLIFTYDQEGDNIEGVSLFRTGYGHWRAIKIFYNIGMIGAERMSLGFPALEYPENYYELSSPDRATIKAEFVKILKNFRAHQYAGALIPPKAKLHLVKGEFNIEALEKLISHHETKIAQCALASFLKIGEARVGSFSLSKDQSEFFMNSLKAIAQDVCDVFNKYLIPELLSYNFNEIDNLPELYVKDIGIRDLKEFADITQTLARSNVLTPDKEGFLEDELRKIFNYPDRTKAQKELSLQALEIVQQQMDALMETGGSNLLQPALQQYQQQSSFQQSPYQGNSFNQNNQNSYNQQSYQPGENQSDQVEQVEK